MEITANNINTIKAHLPTPLGMIFYNSLESIQKDINIIGYISVIERAWMELKLDGVLCFDGRPLLYLKEFNRPFTIKERIKYQRLFWNQGIANILVLVDSQNVYIYSGLAQPTDEKCDDVSEELALVNTLTKVEYIKQIQTLYRRLATGHYYESYQQYFNPEHTVDSWLLDHLRNLRNSLIQGNDKLNIRTAHAFIGRILFLCYLLDRGIISIGESIKSKSTGTIQLTEILEHTNTHRSRLNFLYNIFNDLKSKFNGNMFDQDLIKEKSLIRSNHIDKLILFLGGHDVGTGQRNLGFWAYNFKMIPVETISAIYQDFLGAEDQNKQRKRGAFYTPRFLAEMVVDVAFESRPEAYDWSFLDPACGSGIFLVILFNRLARHWIFTQDSRVTYVKKAKALQKILLNQITGVDIEETACRIACFSLYLAYMDYFDPPDIQQHIKKIGRPLPKLLSYKDTFNNPDADIPVIYEKDFLKSETFTGNKFDCIIGNPPYEGRGTKQIAQKFMEAAPGFLKADGIGCLLLPTKILQNQTDVFQNRWLQRVSLESVLQLADYRHLLFQNAKTPAFIGRFKNTQPQKDNHYVVYAAPKFNRDGLRNGIITINPSARAWIPLEDILEATKSKTAPIVWKKYLWGSNRDQKFLDLLQSLPPLSDVAGKPIEGKRWIKGQGFQPFYSEKAKGNSNYPKPKPNPWGLDTRFVQINQYLQLSVLQSDSMTLGEELKKINASEKYLRRAPHSNLFKAPMVLISRGFGNVAYCDYDVLFQHYLQSISGPAEDDNLLTFLAVYLRSSLAKYFLFHTAANWGTERDYVNLVELLRVPFPLPDHEFISPNAKNIVNQVAEKVRKLQKALENSNKKLKEEANSYTFLKNEEPDISKEWNRERKDRVDSLQNELEPLIYQYFGLTEQEITLIEDTIRIFIPSATPTTWRSPKTVTLNPINETIVEPYASDGLAAYADTLTNTLNNWAEAENSDYLVSAEGGLDNRTGMALVTLILSHKKTNYHQKSFSEELSEVLKNYQSHASKENGILNYKRDIFFFQGEKIHIIRPNILFNWTRTAAINDAAKIYGDVALIHEES
jgi:hypothetical protein